MTHTARWRRIAPALAVAIAFAIMSVLYRSGARAAYLAILVGWGVDPHVPPFLDTETVMSALRCLRQGVDVLAANPCDPLGRVFDYSPLWLVAAHLPVTAAWTAPVGLAVDVGFVGALLLLPAGRSWRETAVIVAGAVSSSAAFAVERGNNDLVILLLAAAAATLACRRPALRLAGYALALLAGLLKYYPMLLMALACREKPKAFWLVSLAALVVVGVFVAIEGHDLARALALIPTGSFFGHMFGATTLPSGLAQIARVSGPVVPAARLALTLVALALGIRAGSSTTLHRELATLTQAERMFLLAGSLLILGCFFTAQNINYRAVLLVLVLPGLTALWRLGTRAPFYRFSIAVMVLLLWSDAWRSCVFPPTPSDPVFIAWLCVWLVAWLLREAGWWWTVTVLISFATALLLQSPLVTKRAHDAD